MKNYIFNLETTKIELHFEKSEYDALSADQKAMLKSNYLWSRTGNCWVSRAKEPHLYRAIDAAKKLGFTEEVRQGERLSYGEQLDRQAERAENRADRYEQYAANADARAEQLQKTLNNLRGDVAFFTQPNINSSAGRSFTNYRNRLFDRYEKGFDEYRKSAYFMDKADVARETASRDKFKDKGYLDRRIKECQKTIRTRQKNIVYYEEILYALENGEEKKKFGGEPITIDEVTSWIEHELELIEVAMDKEGYLLNCLDELGGIQFNKDNIEIGYIVTIAQWGKVKVVGKGTKNITFEILTGGAAGGELKASYAEIIEIVAAEKVQAVKHPFKVGETFQATIYVSDSHSFKNVTYEITKTSDKTIWLKAVNTNEKPIIRKPVFKYGKWRFSIDDTFRNTFYK